jgi:hypothetical protein
LGALLNLVPVLHQTAKTQMIAATHAPLVLASAEPFFDPNQDAWFDLDLRRNGREGRVELKKQTFVRRGDVSKWLTSEAFDLIEPTSVEAEEAITKALALLKTQAPTPQKIQQVDRLLRDSLSDIP